MAKPKPRPIITQPDDPSIRYIALTRGKIAIVDAVIYIWLMQWNWYAEYNNCNKCFYAARRGRVGEPHRVSMHRQILKTDAPHIDHQNGNTLDCRLENLRGCTPSQNHANHAILAHNTSGCSGVDWFKKAEKWRARIMVNGKEISLGLFGEKEDAIQARRDGELKYHGEFAFVNQH
jgi:hypothetical protein